ncbi:MAG: tetratricopeptide repeat protein [Brevinematia bacterium]
MTLQKDIEKILSLYKDGEVLKASQMGKRFYKELPRKVRKVVEVANFFAGVIFSGEIENVIDYTSHLDVVLSKVFFLEGNFEKYRSTVYKVLQNAQDPLAKLYCLKEIKMFDGKGFADLYQSYSNTEVVSKRTEYLKRFLENDFRKAVMDISDFLAQKLHPEVLLDLADIWYYTEQYKELSELCLSIYREGKISDYFLYLYSYSLFSSGKIPDAIAVLEKLAKKYSKNINIVYNLAVCYFRNGDLTKAVELIDLCGNMPYYPEISFTKGVILYRLGRYEDSKKEFSKVENCEEFKFASKYNMSLCDYRIGNYEEAIKRLISLRNESFVDRKNFEAIDRTVWFIKKASRKIPYVLIFLFSLILPSTVGLVIYLILTYLGIR